jgi:hypothetical protein
LSNFGVLPLVTEVTISQSNILLHFLKNMTLFSLVIVTQIISIFLPIAYGHTKTTHIKDLSGLLQKQRTTDQDHQAFV